MRGFILPLALAALFVGPVRAETPAPVVPEEEAPGLMEEGARLFLRGLMSQMEPALDEMGKALDQVEPSLRALEPQLRDLVAMIGDLRNYHAPEKLENGDILIRRKTERELFLERLTPDGTDL